MKLRSAKYTYLMVVLSILVSIGLQSIWLQYLFRQQRVRVQQEIEEVVANTAKEYIFRSVADGKRDSRAGRFFLSREWLQMWIAFDRVSMDHMYKSFVYQPGRDSTVINLRFVANDHRDKTFRYPINNDIISPAEAAVQDSLSLGALHQAVLDTLDKIGLRARIDYALFAYAGIRTYEHKPANYNSFTFKSRQYPYNMHHLHTYQLLVSSVNPYIWYTMRYYLLSCFLMVTLTGTTFYLIIRLMRDRRLYTDARVAFTSNMTHEFKTPIATVTLALESIIKYRLANEPEKLQSYIDISRQELSRLNLMVEKVLNLNEEHGSYQLNLTLFDVQATIQDVVLSMALQFESRRAVCKLILLDEPCFVNGDIVHLTNIFYNLIDNALKYSDSSLNLVIEIIYENGLISISFQDNGPGIPDLFKEKVFDRFFRIPTPGDIHNVKGSGIGLYYVRRIVEKHGGTVRLLSESGKGSNFIISLPEAL